MICSPEVGNLRLQLAVAVSEYCLQRSGLGEPLTERADRVRVRRIVTDLSVAYRFSPAVELQVGVDNLCDVYPDRVRDPRLTNDGTVPYSRFATVRL